MAVTCVQWRHSPWGQQTRGQAARSSRQASIERATAALVCRPHTAQVRRVAASRDKLPAPATRRAWRAGSVLAASAGTQPSSVDAAPGTTSAVALPSGLQKTQLLRAQLGGPGGRPLWLEVVRCRPGRLEVLCEGEVVQLSVDSSTGSIAAAHGGHLPRLGEVWVKSCPGLGDSLRRARQQQAAEEALPSQLLQRHGLAALQTLQTLAAFQAEVRASPAAWRDGTAPGDPPLSEQQQALLTAGELTAFLAGQRGICAVQLWKGWGETAAAAQPLLRPWVLAALEQAAAHKGACMLASHAPEGLGTSLLLAARQQPFRAWAAHLAEIGVQAGIVADSPYYKFLVGRCLGYKGENILHHIESTGSRIDERIMQAVEEELRSLNSAEPQLPWGTASPRKR